MIGGEPHSLPLFILVAGLSVVDATSSVVYLTYIGGFKPQYMSGYYVGEGLSGLIPAVVSLIQGSANDPICFNKSRVVQDEHTGMNHTEYEMVARYDPPRISIEAVLLVLLGMMLVSGVAFALLHHLPYCQRERIDWNEKKNTKTIDAGTCNSTNHPNSNNDMPIMEEGIRTFRTEGNKVSTEEVILSQVVQTNDCSKTEIAVSDNPDFNSFSIDKESPEQTPKTQTSDADRVISTPPKDFKKGLTTTENFVLQLMCFWVNGWLYGVMPASLSYTCLPYGNLAYGLALCLSLVAVPLVSFLALFKVVISLKGLGGLTFFGTVIICFQLYLASLSPNPPLQYEASGQAIVVGTYTYFSIYTFSKFNMKILYPIYYLFIDHTSTYVANQ